MHFVTGGAFNGKRKWVIRTYQLADQENVNWISAYSDQSLLNDLYTVKESYIVLEGIEKWIKEMTVQHPTHECRDIWNETLNGWLGWEQAAKQRTLILIGTDITKGIVPLEEQNRIWRDVTGWCYQDTSLKSTRIDIIWYGINQKIK
ncbi:bifunctional adenosylcobinamide kinase/adenosylcobinamide-phosphate guanylyltransferase [Alkalihalobacillus sp. AL-G]|uniref:bifunctional adenosylcobinamide kinase/adenosylcobinamide-phosphate guanylyltransferase n=1 Tax=Alkalihalobacillus sp. AL-G TaxID=2926399 RepID=UPI00272AB4BB|nr:bifunctional adenosylcobinamide kinase/adenosylcobinamide-phosphate guanylyltransferase [Alkalihalobacillus sp. AL-G]WLD91666.1 bifunctional adenosylcobinamide kinase/adenosylcobinamide-phosphate guanylyltransferase [Alkalihalobacillus sp. AL-G]